MTQLKWFDLIPPAQPVFPDLGIGPVDHRHFMVGETGKLRREAAREQLVRMVCRRHTPVRPFQILVGYILINTKDQVRIIGCASQMSRLDTGELTLRKSKNTAGLNEEFKLVFCDDPVGKRDMKQPVQNVFQRCRLRAKFLGDNRSILLKTQRRLPRKIKKPPNREIVFRTGLKYALEGGDLIGCDLPVRLGHLGPKRDKRRRNARRVNGVRPPVIVNT